MGIYNPKTYGIDQAAQREKFKQQLGADQFIESLKGNFVANLEGGGGGEYVSSGGGGSAGGGGGYSVGGGDLLNDPNYEQVGVKEYKDAYVSDIEPIMTDAEIRGQEIHDQIVDLYRSGAVTRGTTETPQQQLARSQAELSGYGQQLAPPQKEEKVERPAWLNELADVKRWGTPQDFQDVLSHLFPNTTMAKKAEQRVEEEYEEEQATRDADYRKAINNLKKLDKNIDIDAMWAQVRADEREGYSYKDILKSLADLKAELERKKRLNIAGEQAKIKAAKVKAKPGSRPKGQIRPRPQAPIKKLVPAAIKKRKEKDISGKARLAIAAGADPRLFGG